MEQKQAIALFIVVAMVFSSIGFVVLYNQPATDPILPPTDENPPVSGTPLDFEARNVDANIVEILPAIRFVATTSNTSLAALDAKVRLVPGVKNVLSAFQNQGSDLLYRADVSIDADTSAADVVSAIENDPDFQNVSYVSYALLQLPRDINLVTVNADLNIPKSFSFGDAAVDGLVAPESQANDRIRVDILLTLADSEVRAKTIYEVENLSAGGFEGSTTPDQPLRLTVLSLAPRLLATFDIPSIHLAQQSTALAHLNALSDVNDARLYFTPDAPQVELAIDSNTIPSNAERDINAFIAFRTRRLVDTTYQPVFSALVEIDANTDTTKLETDWKNLLQAHGLFDQGAFRPQAAAGQLELTLNNPPANTGGLAAQTLSILNTDLNAFHFEFRQPATFDANDLNINGTLYPIHATLLPTSGLLQPGKSIGDTVDVQARYTINRGQITRLDIVEN